MKLYFRTLQKKDVPAVLEISKDIWEGDDYVPFVIHEWLDDQTSLNYGVFTDPTMNDLIGFGRVKVLNKNLAWLEGGRVKSSYQKQGIGKEIMRYALDYAKEIAVKSVQYDTSSRNEGSVALAKYFGFRKKKTMELLGCKYNEIKEDGLISTKMKKVPIEQAKRIYHKLDIGPGDEICIGWAYVPIDYLTNQNSVWYHNDKAIIQKIEPHGRAFHEAPDNNEIWLIVYGKSKAGFSLVQNVILENKLSNNLEYYIFCTSGLVPKIIDIGFSYWDNQRLQVVLYEKFIDNK